MCTVGSNSKGTWEPFRTYGNGVLHVIVRPVHNRRVILSVARHLVDGPQYGVMADASAVVAGHSLFDQEGKEE